MNPSFVHLHLHSEFSLIDGLISIKALVKKIAQQNIPAVAITDQGNLFCLVRFYQQAIQAGIKPIFGADLWVADPADSKTPFRLLLLVQNAVGYQNLVQLISRSYLEGQVNDRPQVTFSWLEEYAEGLIALTGNAESEIGRLLLSDRQAQAEQATLRLADIYPDRLYLELTRVGRAHDNQLVEANVALASHLGLPVVATNDVHFLEADDFEAHEVRVCINQGRILADPQRPRAYTEQQYLKSPEEMCTLFSDIPEALANSVEIAKRCNLELHLGDHMLPEFPVPEGMTPDSWLVAQAKQGLEQRLTRILDSSAENYQSLRAPYDERLQRELDVIVQMGFAGYFLIVADFIQWAHDQGIPVGPGRGSGAGSLVAYAIRITDLDPLEHQLLFERFLNPERVSMPDFDIDFCMEGRDRVIDYVSRKYGRNAVSQIITFGTMAAKAAVRDVGRVLGHPFGFVDRVAKMVPFELGMTLDKALEQGEELAVAYREDEEIHALIDMARKVEGLARNVGKHAGGVVIAPTKLTDFAPLYCEADGTNLVTQYDKDDVERVGLVKFDFLGLRTLTVIDWALASINQIQEARGLPKVDINAIDVADKASFDLLKRCETTAVFQLESSGMKQLIKKLQPDCFEDIVALVALFRPGPLGSGMVEDFIDRKHGRAATVYPHPALDPVLSPTYGVILYQEQVMQIAQVLAGYSLGGADLLRRAMGKKKQYEMDKQRAIFIKGASERGVDAALANSIFDLMDKFAGYGFNKSHSAAYALVAYQTLWLKTHYPAAFMAAVMSAEMHNTDKIVTLINECRHMKLNVEPPHVNRSEYHFSAKDEKTITYGMGAIKGVGESAIDAIVVARQQAGDFTDLVDFCCRIDLQKVNRRVLEALIRAGALDGMKSNRASMMAYLGAALKVAEQYLSNQNSGQVDLFGSSGDEPSSTPGISILGEERPEWSDEIRLQGEKQVLGLYLTGHPINLYLPEIKQISCKRIANLLEQQGVTGAADGQWRSREPVMIVGMVVAVRVSRTQRGRMGSVLLDDQSGRIEITVFSELFDRVRPLLVQDQMLAVRGIPNFDEYRDTWSMRAEGVEAFEQLRASQARYIEIVLDVATEQESQLSNLITELRTTLEPFRPGEVKIHLTYRTPQAQGVLKFGDTWRIRPTDALLAKLRSLVGRDQVRVVYAKN